MELLTRIDLALKRAGMSRAQLARELGVSAQAISSLGRRRNARLKHANIERAAQVIGCNLTWLATGHGDPDQPSPVLSLSFDAATTMDWSRWLVETFNQLPREMQMEIVAEVAQAFALHLTKQRNNKPA